MKEEEEVRPVRKAYALSTPAFTYINFLLFCFLIVPQYKISYKYKAFCAFAILKHEVERSVKPIFILRSLTIT